MLNHAMGFTPFWLTTGAQMIMALLRTHNATVARRQLSETGVAKPLIKALFGGSVAVNATYETVIVEAQGFAYKFIHCHPGIADRENIGHRVASFCGHFSESPGYIRKITQDLTSTN